MSNATTSSDRSLSAQHGAGLSGPWKDRRRRLRVFVRKLPERRGFLVAAGLEQVLHYLETLSFSSEDLEWLASGGRSARLLDYLAGLRFTGDVHAMPEGTVFFPGEPILRVTAPLRPSSSKRASSTFCIFNR